MDSRKFKAPKIAASCFCSRKPQYYFFNAYFLIFLITSCSLSIFSINYKLPQNRLATSFTILLSSVSFKWVINRSLPTVSYLTSLDKYSIVCIFFVCLLSVWHSLIGSILANYDYSIFIDRCSLGIFFILFIFIHLLLFIWFLKAYNVVRNLKKKEIEYLKENQQETC